MAGYHVAVDLGTTKTAAAVARGNRVTVVALGQRDATIPTVVLVDADGTVVVGDAAVRRSIDARERVAREVKRRVGDDVPVLVGGTPWAAELLLARVLRHVVDHVTAEEGGSPDGIALTHPANWGRYKLDLLVQAARQVGLDPVELVSEPVAAAAWYAAEHRVPDGAVVAVYDLGGGTFDAAVVRRHGDRFEVLGHPDGLERFGGVDIDAAVLGAVTAQLGDAWTSLDATDAETMADVADLRARCVEAKEALSVDTTASIPVRLPTVRTTVRLTRHELEAMVRAPLGETIVALERTIASAGRTPTDLHAVLLVGGASRMPLIGELVSSSLAVPIAVDINPKLAVASGAAHLAARGAAAPARVAPIGPVPKAPAEPEPASAVPPEVPPEPPPLLPRATGPRRPAWVPAAAVAAAIAVLAAGVLLLGGDDGGGDGNGEGDDGAGGEVAVGDDPPEGDGVLRVGVLLPATDTSDGFLEPSMRLAAELAVEDLNDAGGVLGADVELVLVETGEPDTGAIDDPLATLVDEEVDLIVGPVESNDALFAAEVVVDEGLTGCSAHDQSLTSLADDDGRYVRTIPSQQLGVVAITQAITDDGHRSVGVVAPAEMAEYRDALVAALDDEGVTVDPTVEVDADAIDPADAVAQLNDSGSLVAVLVGSDDLANVVVAGQSAGYLGPFYGDETMETDAAGRRVAEAASNGSEIYAISVKPAPDSDVTSRVAERLAEEGADTFPFAAPYVYDCIVLAAVAAESAGSDHPDAIVSEWIDASRDGEACVTTGCLELAADPEGADFDYQGASGVVDLDEDGEVTSGSYDRWQWNADATKELLGQIDV